jgi:hypothetical protein
MHRLRRADQRFSIPMPSVFFITHPDVVINPSTPIADWPLNERGRARMRAMVAASWSAM